jgi:hypothetical protein
MASKWSDDRFLDGLRRQGDPAADQAVARLIAEGGPTAVDSVFWTLSSGDDPIPEDAPAPFREFVAATGQLPPGVDPARLNRAGKIFLEYASTATIVLLAGSLPRGYGARCLCEILSISRDLQNHPYDLLMGMAQLLINISNPDAFTHQGRAVATARKLRLFHAGVRTLVPRFRPGYRERFGVPVNHEDMLATLMAFSYLVIDGLRRLKVGLTDEQAEDFYYLWRVYAQLMGIHPEGRPEDDSLIPATVAEAAEFYASYVRRQNTGPLDNPYGVALTRDNLALMEDLIPKGLPALGFRYAPQICMTELLTPQELARIGVCPSTNQRVVKGVLSVILRVAQGLMDAVPFSSRLAIVIFQGMVGVDRGGAVTFTIPIAMRQLRGSELY